MDTLNTRFRDIIKQVLALSKAPAVITEDNVYQEADGNMLPFLDEMIKAVILPGSGLDGLENLEELLTKAESGKSCLILMEHYSNYDLSVLSYLLRQAGGRGDDIARSIIAIAGMKLNEDNPAVSAFASAYTRIVIYPSRSLLGLDATKHRAEIIRSNAINRAAMKTLTDMKTKGRIVLIFPSGTRFRPWDPATKQGVREVDSYIRSFDYMCLVALNGNSLRVRESDMLEDEVVKDVLRASAGPVLSCTEFRDRVRAEVDAIDPVPGEEGKDKKQAVVDAIMSELEKMHIEAEKKRQEFINNSA